MELRLNEGDYVPDGLGGFQRLEGREALVQRLLFRLRAHRGAMPFWETLGSRLWELGSIPPEQRQAAATQFVSEALEEEEGLLVESVTVREEHPGVLSVRVELNHQGESLPLEMEIR